MASASKAKAEAKEGVGFLKETFTDFIQDECPMRAAALSYYTVFALPPLLLLILLVVSVFVSPERVQELLATQFQGLMGEAGKQQVVDILKSVDRPDASKGFASIVSVIGLLFGATGAFLQLQGALNRAWEVEPDPDAGGLKAFIFKRVLSLGMILGVSFLLLVSLALSAALSAFGDVLGSMVGGLSVVVGYVINFVVSLVVITGLFAAIFKVLPDARIATRDVWVGAFVTSLLFSIGKIGIGVYLGRSNPGEAFGAAGSLALLLVWIYYASMIVLFGAEFTQTWAVRKGSGIEPEEGARRIRETDDEGTAPADEKGKNAGKGGGGRKAKRAVVRAQSTTPHPYLDAHRRAQAAGKPTIPSKKSLVAGAFLRFIGKRKGTD
jgi:membrane protein